MAEFTWPVSIGTSKDSKARVNKAQFGEGYAQRTADGLNPINRTFPVIIKAATLADADAIEAFLDAHAGATSFTWRLPRAAADIRVICESWDRTDRFSSALITATFEQVFEP